MHKNKEKDSGLCAYAVIILLFFAGVSAHADLPKNTTDASTNTAATTTTSEKPATKAVQTETSAAVDATTALNPTTAADDTQASTLPAPTTPALTADPYESFNRVMFTFNDKIDIYIVKPVATFYNTIMPKPLNDGIHNFFNNVGELPTIANDILQLNFYQTVSDSWRFFINTTLGIGGIFDVSSRIGLKYYANDFGLTLAAWGWEESNYLVLPLFGPNTIRDTIEIPVDYFAFSIYPRIHPESARYELYGLGVVDRRAQLLQFQSVLEETAIDKYVFTRNAYMQRRAYQIKENKNLGYCGQGCDEKSAAKPQ